MDYGKYIDMSVQNPHGKMMLRLIHQPENFSKLVQDIGAYYNMRGKDPVEEPEDYALKVLYAAIWAFGVNRITIRQEKYWRQHPLNTISCPWGWIPMEIYKLDMYLDNVIRPQCPW